MVSRGFAFKIVIMNFKILLNKKIKKIYIVLWPPYGDHNKKNIDISICFEFYGEKNIYKITTQKKDNWTPILEVEEITKRIFSFESFENRVEKWQKAEMIDDVDYEYYDFTKSYFFDRIVNNTILDVKYVFVDQSFFGVKLIFEEDYILSTPISDGNTIETTKFHRINNIDYYKLLGKIEYTSLK